jgi:DNA-binding XRE family transcriptional regulator
MMTNEAQAMLGDQLMTVTSAQMRAARAYLGWTMEKAALGCGLHRRTIIRLENDERYALARPASLTKLVALYREHGIVLKNRGLALLNLVPEASSVPTRNLRNRRRAPRRMTRNF